MTLSYHASASGKIRGRDIDAGVTYAPHCEGSSNRVGDGGERVLCARHAFVHRSGRASSASTGQKFDKGYRSRPKLWIGITPQTGHHRARGFRTLRCTEAGYQTAQEDRRP